MKNENDSKLHIRYIKAVEKYQYVEIILERLLDILRFQLFCAPNSGSILTQIYTSFWAPNPLKTGSYEVPKSGIWEPIF